MCGDVPVVSHNHDNEAAAPSTSFSTNAVNRGLSDLHTPTWYALLSLSACFRTVLLHPLNLAISRKRVTQNNPPSVTCLISRAYRGDSGANVASTTRGLRAIYRGFGTAVLGNLIGEVVYLHTLESVKERLECASLVAQEVSWQGRDFSVNSHAAAAGGVAGDLAALIVATPMCVVCNRQMTAGYGMAASNAYRPAWATVREVCRLYQRPSGSFISNVRGCFRGLYAGMSSGIASLPASGLWWGLYSKSKAVLYTLLEPTLSRWELGGDNRNCQQSLWRYNLFLSSTDNLVLNSVAGIIASATTALVFNPVDVLHTRLQTLPPGDCGANGNLSSGRVRYIVRELIRTEGWRALFKGTVASMGAAVLDGVFFSMLFELTKLGSDREFLDQL